MSTTTIPAWLYTKAEKHQDDLTDDERALLLSRDDVIGRALAQPASLSPQDIHKILKWAPPDTASANIIRATNGECRTPQELLNKARSALMTAGDLGAALRDDEITLIRSGFWEPAQGRPEGDMEAAREVEMLDEKSPGFKEAYNLVMERHSDRHVTVAVALLDAQRQVGFPLVPGLDPSGRHVGGGSTLLDVQVQGQLLPTTFETWTGGPAGSEGAAGEFVILPPLGGDAFQRAIRSLSNGTLAWRPNPPRSETEIETGTEREEPLGDEASPDWVGGQWPPLLPGGSITPLDLMKADLRDKLGISDNGQMLQNWEGLTEERREAYKAEAEARRLRGWQEWNRLKEAGRDPISIAENRRKRAREAGDSGPKLDPPPTRPDPVSGILLFYDDLKAADGADRGIQDALTRWKNLREEERSRYDAKAREINNEKEADYKQRNLEWSQKRRAAVKAWKAKWDGES